MARGAPFFPSRRVLLVAFTIFFVGSTYLCASRLFGVTYTRENFTGPGSSPSQDDSESYKNIKLNQADLPMAYGVFGRPPLDNLKTVATLPNDLVPTVENGRRLIVIGDIHGMDTELKALLDEVSFDPQTDHVISTGDMVNKGPDSAAVVAHLMSLNASAVRGNHEDRLLLAQNSLHTQFGVSADLETPEAAEHRGELDKLVLARTLSQEQLDWLASLPVILSVEPLRMYIVHGGLMPGINLANQDPWAVMNMRTVVYPREHLRQKAKEEPRIIGRSEDAAAGAEPPSLESLQEKVDGVDPAFPSGSAGVDMSQIPFDRRVAVPDDGRKGEKWSGAWSEYQIRLPEHERRTVVYGHDAKLGYRETEYTFGLDSNCVRGGALSALVIRASQEGDFNQTLTQVQCRQATSR